MILENQSFYNSDRCLVIDKYVYYELLAENGKLKADLQRKESAACMELEKQYNAKLSRTGSRARSNFELQYQAKQARLNDLYNEQLAALDFRLKKREQELKEECERLTRLMQSSDFYKKAIAEKTEEIENKYKDQLMRLESDYDRKFEKLKDQKAGSRISKVVRFLNWIEDINKSLKSEPIGRAVKMLREDLCL